MTDHYWPSLLEPASSQLEILSSAGRFQSPLSGFTRTASRPGERMRLTLSFQNTNSAMRAAVQYAIARMQGATHRIWAHDHSNRIRGSFPATELLTNNTFADGLTGWTPAACTLVATDRVMRMKLLADNATAPSMNQNVSVTLGVPYVARALVLPGGVNYGAVTPGAYINTGIAGIAVENYVSGGMSTAVVVAVATGTLSGFYVLVIQNDSFGPGAFVEVPFTSFSRCALVDNRPNAMTRSDELDHADWAKSQCSISANAAVAADGTVTADAIVENSAASVTHTIAPATHPTRSSVAEHLCVYGDFKRGSGTRDIQLRVGSDSSNFSHCIFDLGAGTAGSVTNSGTATNGRAFIRDMGNGIYRCWLIARAAASTQLYTLYSMVNAGSNTYTGDGTSSIYGWRLGSCRSGVPVNPPQTVATALPSGTTQALAGPLQTKGWPVSTDGLLLPGDQVQIGNQLHIVTASVNSDAAGLATLECYPARRSAPADNAPVIITQPMGKFFLESDANGWSNKPGIFSDAEIVLAEAS